MQPVDTPKLNLYIVDDDEGVRDALAIYFVARRYRVQAFESGEAFLAGVDLTEPGCVILDVRMPPGISGIQVFDELQKQASPLVVILLSGHLDVPTTASSMEKGALLISRTNGASISDQY